MLHSTPTPLSSLSAAANRLEIPGNNVAAQATSGVLPTTGAPIGQEAYDPGRADQSSVGGTSSIPAPLRSTTPAYLAVYDAKKTDADDKGATAKPDDTAEVKERADQAEASRNTAKTLAEADALVKKRYDIT
jgi:hypothetical protein